MDRFLDSVGVWFGGGRELQAPSPKVEHNYPGNNLAKVEAFEEVWVQSQVQGYDVSSQKSNPQPTDVDTLNLPGGGQYDKLLAPGLSSSLMARLASIFKDDPPVQCGSNRDLVGLSCAYSETYGKLVFSPAAVAKHLQLAFAFWTPLPKETVQHLVVTAGSRLIIVGDTHGQLEDVLWMFFKYGPPSPTNQYLFNGDIVDRGGHSLEILLLLFAIKRDIPSSIHVQRGNHEDCGVNMHFGFRAELESKFQGSFGAIWNICSNIVFPLLPLATVVTGPLTGGRHFCVLHGGVPVDIPGQEGPVSLEDDLVKIDRLRPTLQGNKDRGDHILFNLVWSDPCDSVQRKKLGQAGRGNRFVERETIEFCERNDLAFVVRSHEVPRSLRGAAATHGGKTYTVFSASNYMGSVGNRGGVFLCEVDRGLQLNEHWAPPWPVLAELYEAHFQGSAEGRAQVVKSWEKKYLANPQEDNSNAANADASPRSPAHPSAEAQARADDQILQFMVERVCESKDQLFKEFCSYDQAMTGLLPKAVWSEVMLRLLEPLCDQVLTPALLEHLASRWGLADPVGYVRFLHRFQIRGSGAMQQDAQPDLLRQVSALRRQLVDAPVAHLEQLLDPNGDRSVSLSEFQSFLPRFGIEVTPLQAGVLYEMMSNFTKQKLLTLDHTIVCLALMSRDPPSWSQWSQVAEKIGGEINKAGKSYAYAFRLWDTDRDGYLSQGELQEGLSQLLPQKLPTQHVANFMQYIEGMGVTNDRISIFEFVRAVAPRDWAMQLHQALLKDLLKRVWICRPALHALLVKSDPQGSMRATVGVFHSCMEEINRQLEVRGRPQLSPMQLQAICEIASNGRSWVAYEDFIRGLHVVDAGAAD
mmetsp:Transcript_12346/g.35010  ORF Transcript_12346/g.35010 Transcript_12346/m.35010 type:complete len:865 (-) Transcript_12346:105-2699(-)